MGDSTGCHCFIGEAIHGLRSPRRYLLGLKPLSSAGKTDAEVTRRLLIVFTLSDNRVAMSEEPIPDAIKYKTPYSRFDRRSILFTANSKPAWRQLWMMYFIPLET